MADQDPEKQKPAETSDDVPSGPAEGPAPGEGGPAEEGAEPPPSDAAKAETPDGPAEDDFLDSAADPHGWSSSGTKIDPPGREVPDAPLTLDPPPVAAPKPDPKSEARPRPAPRPRKTTAPRRKSGLVGWLIRRALLALLIVGVLLPVASTLIYRVIGPPITILMIQRLFEGKGLDRHWVPLKAMSPALPYAVIAAEDARYCSHFGFDFEAMEKAAANNQRRPGKVRGGSTISQQTAKNVFLWPQRSYIRKGFEAWFTVLIETLWGKSRIMEVYLNTIEWGPGIYGADAAARRYFGVGADSLSPAQAARLAAILPSPLKWQAAKPGPYVRKRSRRIGAASGTVRRQGLAACVKQD